MFRKTILSSFFLFSSVAFATPHYLVAPTCLTKQISVTHTILAQHANLALVKTDDAGVQAFIKAKIQPNTKPCGGFMDVTAAWKNQDPTTFLKNHSTPTTRYIGKNEYKIQYKTEVNQLLATLNPENMWTDLNTLTNFQTRYAASENGIKAAEWIQSRVENMAKDAHREDVSIRTVATGSFFTQPSIVVKLGKSNEPGVVIGGHMDTLSAWWGRMPGADDDGSGSSTVLELTRVLFNSGMEFKKPIYLVWYAAEEEGLYGSQAVVADFKEKKIQVDSVLQLDMTGYAYQNDLTMWLMKDYVSPALTSYLEKLITTYVKKPVKYTQCGYACSDHASWHTAGFPAAFPTETAFGNDNPDIHTENDTMDKLSLEHMTSFAKLAVAFAVERAEPVTKN